MQGVTNDQCVCGRMNGPYNTVCVETMMFENQKHLHCAELRG